ncbi:MAG: hypothetical protein NZ700_11010 [Gemmataceae bacterium]|nr:hypothetical protein [Gemmataceae bacterium]MDW8266694.1 hypothetical protein [Gemmataceae bacterium]
MEMVYLVCAALGGTLLVVQFLLGMAGLGGDHDIEGGDADHDAGQVDGHAEHESQWFVGLLTFRALVSAMTFFGLAGMAAQSRGLSEPVPLGIAVASGAGAMFLVAWLMRLLHSLKAEGNIHIERALGQRAKVYLSIPAQKSGRGKVSLTLQNRLVEVQAITSGDELPTGADVVVVGVINSDTVEVSRLAEEHTSHA